MLRLEKLKNVVGLFVFAVSMFFASTAMKWITDKNIKDTILKSIKESVNG